MREKIIPQKIRIVFALFASISIASLSACSSGSMTGGATAVTVTASFAGATMPSTVAYQAGTSGSFQLLSPTGSSVSFTLPSGVTAYGFAYRCPKFYGMVRFWT